MFAITSLPYCMFRVLFKMLLYSNFLIAVSVLSRKMNFEVYFDESLLLVVYSAFLRPSVEYDIGIFLVNLNVAD